MKIKYNIPKINELKNKLNVLKNKVRSNNKNKVPMKYYALLFLMLMLGIITLFKNIKEYNKVTKEEYKTYTLSEKNNSKNNSIKISKNKFPTKESSISTTVEYEASVQTISSQNKNNYIMPIQGKIIKKYAKDELVYSNTLQMWRTHPGVDIAANIEDEVISSCDGKVIDIIEDDFYGITVKIINSEGYIFVYSNLDDVIKVKINDNIKQKQVIGNVGVTAKGELLDETHLHFEILKDNVQINPLELIEN